MQQKPDENGGNRVNHPSANRAVSPVIGVILMVAITVILAATIGTFVIDMGGSVGEPTSQVSFSVKDHSDDYSGAGDPAFVIDHNGGDDLLIGDLEIQVRNRTSNRIKMKFDGESDGVGSGTLEINGDTAVDTDVVSTGDQLIINDSNGDLSDDKKYRLVIVEKVTDKAISKITVTLR